MVKIIEIAIPFYLVTEKPDYFKVGKRIHDEIKKHFSSKLILRAISMSKRPWSDLESTVKEIVETGSDRTREEVLGRGYHKSQEIDFFAMACDFHSSENVIEPFIRYFYEKPIEHHSPPERVDVIIVYDPGKVELVPHIDEKGRQAKDGYKFKDQTKKQKAVLGVVKIVNWK